MSIVKPPAGFISVCRLFYVYTDEVTNIIDGSDLHHKIVYLKNAAAWKEIYFSRGSADFSEVEKAETAGSLFGQTLKFLLPGDYSSNAETIKALSEKLVIFSVEYSNADIKLVGSLTHRARISRSFKMDPKYCGQEFTLLCTDTSPSPWLEETR
jgi:hypothetical protein